MVRCTAITLAGRRCKKFCKEEHCWVHTPKPESESVVNTDEEYIDDKDLAADLAELLNKVRNNLFHGGKSYDNREDIFLIKSLLPIMKDLTEFAVKERH